KRRADPRGVRASFSASRLRPVERPPRATPRSHTRPPPQSRLSFSLRPAPTRRARYPTPSQLPPRSGSGSADGDSVDSNRRQTYPDRHRLAVLAARADTCVERQVVGYHRNSCEHIGAVANQRRALHGPGDFSILYQVGLTRREDELPIGDIDLTSPEADSVQPLVHRLDYNFRSRLAAKHEGVGHARHRGISETLPAAVAGRCHLHQSRVHPILKVSAQNSVFNQHGPRGRRPFVIDVEAAAAIRDRAIVDDRAEFARDLLTN